MPFVSDAAVAGGELEKLVSIGERVLQVGVRLQGAEVTSKCDVLIDANALAGQEEHQVLKQQGANRLSLLRARHGQIKAAHFRAKGTGQPSDFHVWTHRLRHPPHP